MVRLKDIARRASVSVMTVSKALRNAPDISESTKARIRLLAQQMGYVPDALAQSLRTRRTRLLGLLIPATSNPMFARIVLAIEERATELGFDLILAHTLNRAEREELAIRRILSRRIDGLFISPVYRLEPQATAYVELEARRTPVVILGHKAPFCAAFANVETDDIAGSHALTRHLIELGHTRIAFLAGPAACPWAQERLEGHRRALREAQIEPDDALLFTAGSTIEEGEKAALQLLHEQASCTAIAACNDLVAIGAANVLLSQGIPIPGRMSVAGFGNILLSEHFRIPLTTVSQPKYRQGTVAMDLMLRITSGESPLCRRLPTELVRRASTGPCTTQT
jgi:LacI family transcriptional regulator